MLENLLQLVNQHAGEAIINNPDVPNEKNEAVMQTAGNSIIGGLQNVLASGGLNDVLRMFGGQDNNQSANRVTEQVSGNVIQNLMQQFQMNQGQATQIANGLVPGVLSNLVQKTNDPSDNSFDLQGIFNSLSGGRTSGLNIQGLLGKLSASGFDKDGDGDVDLNDLKAAFAGSGGTGGGLMDTVKGMFG